MKKFIFFIIMVLFMFNVTMFAEASSFENPRIGIIISKASIEHRWGVTQMAAHGWAAVANLAGIPYDCLFISDLPGLNNIEQYDLLVFAQCTYLDNQLYDPLIAIIEKYFNKGGHIILDGPLALNDEDARERNYDRLFRLLGIEYRGFSGDSTFRLKISENSHYITRDWQINQYISQHVANGLNIVDFIEKKPSQVVLTNEQTSYPFLTCRQDGNSRVILVNDFSTWAGVASFFRNVQPQVFYANQVFNVLLRAIHWGIYGDISDPFPVPQVTNANLTAIVRLDADVSGNLDAQIKTINYLGDLAKETGVVPVYAWVSSGATKAGWQDLAPLGKMIEDAGGEVGTHSRFHRINREMNEKRWKEELDDAIEEIEFNMSDYGYSIGKVEFFINPGNTIRMEDYGQIASRFSFYMTHGFEQDMPLGYGNLTWFAGAHKNFVVLENTPSPDYQWFYDPTWSYTTQQITAYEEAIFDHMYTNVGRGVIFNEMWHDYSITSQPQYGKDRIMNKNNIAFYDGIKAKFLTHDIYCPHPVELTNKLCAMAQWNYEWKSEANEIILSVDLSSIGLETIPDYCGGMGIKVENTQKYIQKVYINDESHPAFGDRVVILPNLKAGKNAIRIILGENPSQIPRLTYVSKHMPVLTLKNEDINFEVKTKSKAKFSFYNPGAFVLLNADWQEWNRTGNKMLNAYVQSDRKVVLKKQKNQHITLTYSGFNIKAFLEETNRITLSVQPTANKNRSIIFSAKKVPKQILFDNKDIGFVREREYKIILPEFETAGDLIISF